MKTRRKYEAIYWICLMVWFPLLCFGIPTLQQVRDRNILTVEQLMQYERQAKKGDSFSQVFLGEAYRVGGIGIIPDEKKAFYWLRKALETANPVAEQKVALMYLQGTGVDQDFQQYRIHAKKAFDGLRLVVLGRQGSREFIALSEYCLGTIYFWGVEGITVPDLKRSFDLTKDSAEYGYIFAIHRLIAMYQEGFGVEKNQQEAFRWSLLLAQLGDREKQYVVGMAYLHGQGVVRDEQKAFEWLRASLKQGYYKAIATMLQLKRQGKLKTLSDADSRNFQNILDRAGQAEGRFIIERIDEGHL